MTRELKTGNSAVNSPKLYAQVQELKSVKKETEKYEKIVGGMLKFLEDIDARLVKK